MYARVVRPAWTGLALLPLLCIAQPAPQGSTAAPTAPTAGATAAPSAPPSSSTPQLALPRPGIDVIAQLIEAETLALEKRAKDAIAAAKAAASPVSPATIAALDAEIPLEPPPVLIGIEGPASAPVGRFNLDGRVVLASAAAPALGASAWRLVEIGPGRAVVTRTIPARGKVPPKVERLDLALAPPAPSALARGASPTAPMALPSFPPPTPAIRVPPPAGVANR
jgi:hypothetical protein